MLSVWLATDKLGFAKNGLLSCCVEGVVVAMSSGVSVLKPVYCSAVKAAAGCSVTRVGRGAFL